MTYEGVLLIDKQMGDSSHQVVGKVRKLLGEKKVGHAGTLDPFATGLLIVLVGRYTKASNFLQNHDKIYEASVYFGYSTTTDDREGEVIDKKESFSLSEKQISQALTSFVGTHKQIPPQFSAISLSGERAYKKARRGEMVEMPEREVTFYQLELLSFQFPIAHVRVHCSKGTYIRAFARDLGKHLGIPAHLSELRRVNSGDFSILETVSLNQIDKNLLVSRLLQGKSALRGMEFIELSQGEAHRLSLGQKIPWKNPDKNASVKVALFEEEIIAFAQVQQDHLVSVRGF